MMRSLWLPLLTTVLMHAVILLVIIVGLPSMEVQVTVKKPVQVVQARLVKLEQAKPKPAPKPSPAPASKPAPKPKPDPRPAPKPVPESKPAPAPKPKVDPQAEQQRLEAERQQREQALREQQLEQIRQEMANSVAREEAAAQARNEAEMAQSYSTVVQRAIERQWSRPPSARNDMEAELIIHLIPTGEVVSVVVAVSSGNDAFDRSAENAVKKAGRFPELQDLPPQVFEQYFRRFRLVFNPEDLRR